MAFHLNLVSKTILTSTVLLCATSAYAAMEKPNVTLQTSPPQPKASSSAPATSPTASSSQTTPPQPKMSSSTPASQTTMSSSSASVNAGALVEAKSPNTTTSKK